MPHSSLKTLPYPYMPYPLFPRTFLDDHVCGCRFDANISLSGALRGPVEAPPKRLPDALRVSPSPPPSLFS